MKGIEEFGHDGVLIAIIIRKEFKSEGVNFISKESFPLQVGVNFYKKGHEIKPHIHQKRKVEFSDIQEVVRVDSGYMTVDLYSDKGKKFASAKMKEGDTIFFVSGGHSLEMQEDTRLTEVKQGPYPGKEKDKKMIE